jgi:hypothetical protein
MLRCFAGPALVPCYRAVSAPASRALLSQCLTKESVVVGRCQLPTASLTGGILRKRVVGKAFWSRATRRNPGARYDRETWGGLLKREFPRGVHSREDITVTEQLVSAERADKSRGEEWETALLKMFSDETPIGAHTGMALSFEDDGTTGLPPYPIRIIIPRLSCVPSSFLSDASLMTQWCICHTTPRSTRRRARQGAGARCTEACTACLRIPPRGLPAHVRADAVHGRSPRI